MTKLKRVFKNDRQLDVYVEPNLLVTGLHFNYLTYISILGEICKAKWWTQNLSP